MAELKRTLGFWFTSAFTFLNLVNTGVFLGIQVGIQTAGVASIFAWIMLGFLSIYTAMCFSELTTMFPTAGGVYEFAKQAYGRLASFQVGWVIWLINNIATALLIAAAVEYLLPDTPFVLGTLALSATTFKLLIAIGLIIVMNYVAFRGADDSAKMMLILAIFTLILFAIVIIPGIAHLQVELFFLAEWKWPALLAAAFLLSETFFGWESVSFMAEEIKDPAKTIPKALNSTAIFVALCSVAIAAITMSVLDSRQLLGLGKPLITVLKEMGFSSWAILIANLGVVMAFIGNAAGGVIGNPRLLMALSRDKLFIEQFSDIHPKYQTPHKGILLQTVVAVLIVLLAAGEYAALLALVVAPSMVLYVSMIVLVPYFRWRRPDAERPYSAPFGKVLPFVLVLFYAVMFVMWATMVPDAVDQLRILLGFILLSIPIYLVLTYFYDPDALIGTTNRFAIFSLWLENLFVPKRLRREVLDIIPEARSKNILEFGAGVGTLTMDLAEHVGPRGKVYAVDLSEHNVRLLERRIAKRGHSHITVIHDPHLVSRVHPDVKNIDMIVSVGNLSYVQDVERILRDMNDLLPARGKICFIEYIDFFYFLPNNPKWLSDSRRIQETFSKAGFAVRVELRRGLLWKYLYIYGIKKEGGGSYI